MYMKTQERPAGDPDGQAASHQFDFWSALVDVGVRKESVRMGETVRSGGIDERSDFSFTNYYAKSRKTVITDL